jgi:hypothetical protein
MQKPLANPIEVWVMIIALHGSVHVYSKRFTLQSAKQMSHLSVQTKLHGFLKPALPRSQNKLSF